MNAINRTFAAVETKFWHAVIIFLSESEFAKIIVPILYTISNTAIDRYKRMPLILQCILWLCFGWSFGVSLGMAGAIFAG